MKYSRGCWYFPFNTRLCNVGNGLEITASTSFGGIAIFVDGTDRDEAASRGNFHGTRYGVEKTQATNERNR